MTHSWILHENLNTVCHNQSIQCGCKHILKFAQLNHGEMLGGRACEISYQNFISFLMSKFTQKICHTLHNLNYLWHDIRPYGHGSKESNALMISISIMIQIV